ncbi:MAG: hypothetical protein CM15mP49_13590 [Actinomycetota bacterium]|nr:MAG: hypothetical protein CM15mP49_13590 [Actinomycetota bacterium]
MAECHTTLPPARRTLFLVLVAIAAERGLLSFDDPVSKHLDQGWSQSAPKEEASITVWHLANDDFRTR